MRGFVNMKKKGAIAISELLMWLLFVGAVALFVVLVIIFTKSGGGAIDKLGDLLKFGR